MDLFPDLAFVRLRSSVHNTYLHADEDGVTVCLKPEHATMNAVWKVHRILRNGTPLFLLHGTAYGRYLVTTRDRAPFGLRGRRVLQGVYDDQEQNTAVWSATRVARGNNEVTLQLVSHLRLLRANGEHWQRARSGVSVDRYVNRSPMMHWVVEAVPPLPHPPIFAPPEDPAPAPPPVPPKKGILGLFRRSRPEPTLMRTIRYVRADANGHFDDQGWTTFQFEGRSAWKMRFELTQIRNEHYFYFNITACARPGRYGRLTPLIADLPRNQEPIDVVAIDMGPVEAALWYPNVDALPTTTAQATSEEIESITASDTT
ncbi:hypothetical protein PR202_gb17816 [Eleusine coracana subsp. coracana]|uniref:DUF569 domain-containing protein n=1 Tax=Eleusine coracana subsp. coracana TaxID=191504 RepID=A0AAV5F5I1_ELECO|nr:hypothetical protein PR202_gb17816 [Eleusine coracana subsp. coracana]